ncbi:MAG: hypothetical protein QOJ58_3676 [Alphaproteobacteria bacterium]|nr:hypothetical protein [Alphaproteobacteria bacterium]
MSVDAMLANRKFVLPTFMACAAVFATVGQAAVSGDFAGLFEIGAGRKMYLECRGTGSPTVVLVAGLKGSAGDWSIAAPLKPTVFADVATGSVLTTVRERPSVRNRAAATRCGSQPRRETQWPICMRS